MIDEVHTRSPRPGAEPRATPDPRPWAQPFVRWWEGEASADPTCANVLGPISAQPPASSAPEEALRVVKALPGRREPPPPTIARMLWRGSTARFLAWLPLCLALLAVALPARARVIGRTAEISIGRETASAVEKAYMVDVDVAAVSRVRQIGRRLASASDDADFPYEFHVVESKEINAFALPGGFVYIYRGLLQLLPNDESLAFVMAHEISHVTGHHSIRQFEKSLVLNAAITGLLAGTGARGFNDVALVVQEVTGLSYTRHDEGEADTHGMQTLARAGYNPKGGVEAMEVLERAAMDEKSLPALFRSHPTNKSRIRKLGELATEINSQRAVSRTTPQAVAPAPRPVPRAIAGLTEIRVVPSEWAPLRTGSHWTYRTGTDSTAPQVTVRVLEELQAEPRGVYRVEYDLGRGIRAVRLLAPAGDRLWTRADPPIAGEAWRLEALFAPSPADATSLRCGMVEKVRVPAGEFDALRVERLGPDGAVESSSWYARGVGLVKRVSTLTGTTQELLSYQLPRE